MPGLFEAAIREQRCAELLDALFEGGSATVDTEGHLVIADADMIEQWTQQLGRNNVDE